MEKVFQPWGLVLSKGNTRYFMTKPAKITIASSVDLVQCMVPQMSSLDSQYLHWVSCEGSGKTVDDDQTRLSLYCWPMQIFKQACSFVLDV